MRVIAVVQARIGSTRLSNKVFADICGKSMLQHVIERVQRAETLDAIVLAVPTMASDAFQDVVRTTGVGFYDDLINADDVLGRLFLAGQGYDLVVRVPADNPCIEPSEIDRLVRAYIPGRAELWSNTHNFCGRINGGCYGWNGYPDGIGAELYDAKHLAWMRRTIDSPHLREHPHVHGFLLGSVATVTCPVALTGFPDVRLDVNTQDDLDRIRALYERKGGDNAFRVNSNDLVEWSNNA